jgi:hypothetical protein
MTKNISSRILCPLALTLLVASTGCAVDSQSDSESNDSTNRVQQYGAVDAGAAAEQNSGLEFAATKSTLGQSTTGDAIVVRENPNTPEAPQPNEPEAPENNNPGEEEEEPGDVNPGDSQPVEPVDPSLPSELTQEQGERIGELIANASPLQVVGTLAADDFVDFDFGGLATTEESKIYRCTEITFDGDANTLAIDFDCSALGADAPTGSIECLVAYPKAGKAAVACSYNVNNNLGLTQGSVDVDYELNSDEAAIEVNADVPQAGGRTLQVKSKTDVSPWADAAGENPNRCYTETGYRQAVSSNETMHVNFSNVRRCDNSCQPETGNMTFSSYLENAESAVVINANHTDASGWIVSDDSGSAISGINFCE